jgi:hypothetical protein
MASFMRILGRALPGQERPLRAVAEESAGCDEGMVGVVDPGRVMRLASVPMMGRLLAAVRPNERVVRAMFRRIGLRQALDAGRVPQEVLDCYLALLRDTATMRNELRAGLRLVFPLRGMNAELLAGAGHRG